MSCYTNSSEIKNQEQGHFFTATPEGGDLVIPRVPSQYTHIIITQFIICTLVKSPSFTLEKYTIH